MTLSDAEGHYLLYAFSNVIFISCVAVETISTEIARRAVPLR